MQWSVSGHSESTDCADDDDDEQQCADVAAARLVHQSDRRLDDRLSAVCLHVADRVRHRQRARAQTGSPRRRRLRRQRQHRRQNYSADLRKRLSSR